MRNKILTIDDSKTVRLIVRRALRPFDCEVYEAPNGTVGVEVALLIRPDLILLDTIMPVMDGQRTLIELRASPDLGHVPVIMLVCNDSRGSWLRAYETGVGEFIAKPFGCDAVVRKVGRILSLKPLNGERGVVLPAERGSRAPWRG